MHPYVVLDVFTTIPLQGNQLAVFTEADEIGEALMQRTARELNLSETVFLLAPDDEDADARVRIFTPKVELPFAGHPVLGAAFVVGASTGTDAVSLQTGAGVVPIALTREDGKIVAGEMEQPIPVFEPFARAGELLRALGVERSGLPIEAYRNGSTHVYVELPSEPAVAALKPDFAALEQLGAIGVNCFAGEGGHFKTRMFAPGLGVPEDPATGSAAGPLALHLVRHGRVPFGRQIEISQGVEIGRPSWLCARVDGSAGGIERIAVAGAAVVVARGEYRLD